MQPAVPADNEAARLQALRALDVLDTAPEAQFDALVQVASIVCGVPISLISLIDANRQWFKANVGLPGATETPRDIAFCAHAVLEDRLFEIPDAALDPRFFDNPLVLEHPDIRFYAGMPLSLRNGLRVGTLCVIDRQPRQLNDTQREVLRHLAVVAADALEGRSAMRNMAAATRALLDSEDRLRRLYESTPTMLHSINAQGRLVMVSDTWLAKLGYTRAEVIGRLSSDFLTPASRDYAQKVVLPAFFAAGRCDNIEYQMVTKDGWTIDVLLSATLERDDAGLPRLSIATMDDVTLRHYAERALQEERQRLSNIIEGMHVGTWEWNVQTGDVRFNAQWAEMLGHTLAELEPITFQTWLDHLHPDDHARSSALLARHFSGELDRYEIEARMRHSSGRWVWVLCRGRLIGRTVDGEPEWMFGTHLEITDRKHQEEALHKSRVFLDRTGRLAGVGGWELDLVENRLFWSEHICRIHGVEPGYVPTVEQGIAFYTPEDRPRVLAAVETAMRGGPGFDMEAQLVRADGQTIWVRSVGSVEFADGKPVRLVGAFQDVSERVAERLALVDANERVNLATNSGGIGIWDWDVASNVMKWDAWMFRLYAFPANEDVVTLELCLRYVHPDDMLATEGAIRAAVQGGESLDTIFRIVWPDGRVHYLRATGVVKRDAAGQAVRMVGTSWDITVPRRLAIELAEQHEMLRVTLQSIGDAVITTDAGGRVVWLNPVAEGLTGWLSAEAAGRPLPQVFHIVHQETRALAENPVEVCLQREGVASLAQHTVLISRNGLEFGIEDSASPIRNAQGDILGAVLVFHDVTEQRRLSGEMSYRASHDALTGLVNRAEFETRLSRALRRAHEEHCEHALLYIDLDQFKLVNDACGHAVGDQLLQQVSKLLGLAVRERDTLARLGGDEFGIILEHCTAEQAQRVAQQICDRMEEFRFVYDGRRFRIGTSIGLVPVDSRWNTTEALQQAADTACYAAKEAGRNRVHTWFDSDLSMRARQGEMQWTTRIEQALDEDRFVLHAQRIEALHGVRPGLHAEVLLRLQEADGTLVLPGAFLPAAERFHLASRIDRWVLKHAVAWMQALPDTAVLEELSINLSGQSVGDRVFHRWALDVLSTAGPDICHRLCFEITETAAVTNMADAALFVEQIRAIGVRVALDDFGAGASSFGYLKTLPVDYLKIDGQFVRDVVDDPLDDAAVRCFVDVARVVGVQTVAEFVDNPAVLERLRQIGVDFVQGFLLHKPAPIQALLEAGVQDL
ncbi:EAL domain-containing protein [Rhodoferax sp.]|uniref:EAL domain-containing protein n=1 Tax=Rhodoferax sp. TaxID=50421 RepID=UPI00374D4D1F